MTVPKDQTFPSSLPNVPLVGSTNSIVQMANESRDESNRAVSSDILPNTSGPVVLFSSGNSTSSSSGQALFDRSGHEFASWGRWFPSLPSFGLTRKKPESESTIPQNGDEDLRYSRVGLFLFKDQSPDYDGVVDIIALHGLDGDYEETWTMKLKNGTKVNWVKDLLPKQIPNARIFSYGYNSRVEFSKSKESILNFAETLLELLQDVRTEPKERARPIVFICHSLGGIVCKSAMIRAHEKRRYKEFSAKTSGIVFMGTPHAGADISNWMTPFGNILKVASLGTSTNTALLASLKRNSDILYQISKSWVERGGDLKLIWSFYETEKMDYMNSKIVEEPSAVLNWPGIEETAAAMGNHITMCKFSGPEDKRYQFVSKRILQVTNKALEGNEGGRQNYPYDSGTSLTTPANKHFLVSNLRVSRNFTGRTNVRQMIEGHLLPNPLRKYKSVPTPKLFIIWGLGGTGKSQVCLKFAYQHKERYWGIFWIDATTPQTAAQSFVAIGQVLGLGSGCDSRLALLTLAKIQKQWLLIIDNVDEQDSDVKQYIPICPYGSVLLTSRNEISNSGDHCESHELGQLLPEEALEILFKESEIQTDNIATEVLRDAIELVELQGFMVLAIVQAAAYVREGNCSLHEYIDLYRKHRRDLMSNDMFAQSLEYRKSVYTTWEISLEKIKSLSTSNPESHTPTDAIQLLGSLSFFHNEGISEETFVRAWRSIHILNPAQLESLPLLGVYRRGNYEDESSWLSLRLRPALFLLKRFSLISKRQDDTSLSTVSVHPLVHAWSRDRLCTVDKEEARMKAFTIATLSLSRFHSPIEASFDYRCKMVVHLEGCRGKTAYNSFRNGMPHRQWSVRGQMSTEMMDELFLNLEVAQTLQVVGRTTEARTLYEEIRRISSEQIGIAADTTLIAAEGLCMCLHILGKDEENRNFRRWIIEVKSQRYVKDDFEMQKAENDLAMSYHYCGDTEAARKRLLRLHIELLAVLQRNKREDKSGLLYVVRNNITSVTNGHTSHDPFSEILYGRVFGYEALLGGPSSKTEMITQQPVLKQHGMNRDVSLPRRMPSPDILTSMVDLANTYERTGNQQAALNMWGLIAYNGALQFGPEHPLMIMAFRKHAPLAISKAKLTQIISPQLESSDLMLLCGNLNKFVAQRNLPEILDAFHQFRRFGGSGKHDSFTLHVRSMTPAIYTRLKALFGKEVEVLMSDAEALHLGEASLAQAIKFQGLNSCATVTSLYHLGRVLSAQNRDLDAVKKTMEFIPKIEAIMRKKKEEKEKDKYRHARKNLSVLYSELMFHSFRIMIEDDLLRETIELLKESTTNKVLQRDHGVDYSNRPHLIPVLSFADQFRLSQVWKYRLLREERKSNPYFKRLQALDNENSVMSWQEKLRLADFYYNVIPYPQDYQAINSCCCCLCHYSVRGSHQLLDIRMKPEVMRAAHYYLEIFNQDIVEYNRTSTIKHQSLRQLEKLAQCYLCLPDLQSALKIYGILLGIQRGLKDYNRSRKRVWGSIEVTETRIVEIYDEIQLRKKEEFDMNYSALAGKLVFESFVLWKKSSLAIASGFLWEDWVDENQYWGDWIDEDGYWEIVDSHRENCHCEYCRNPPLSKKSKPLEPLRQWYNTFANTPAHNNAVNISKRATTWARFQWCRLRNMKMGSLVLPTTDVFKLKTTISQTHLEEIKLQQTALVKLKKE